MYVHRCGYIPYVRYTLKWECTLTQVLHVPNFTRLCLTLSKRGGQFWLTNLIWEVHLEESKRSPTYIRTSSDLNIHIAFVHNVQTRTRLSRLSPALKITSRTLRVNGYRLTAAHVHNNMLTGGIRLRSGQCHKSCRSDDLNHPEISRKHVRPFVWCGAKWLIHVTVSTKCSKRMMDPHWRFCYPGRSNGIVFRHAGSDHTITWDYVFSIEKPSISLFFIIFL